MFSKDAEWYVNNLDQIAAFGRWIELVKSDLPKQVSNLIRTAAEQAVNDLNNTRGSDSDYSAVYYEQGGWGH